MSEIHEIRVPHDNVNDDSVMLRAWRIADGETVETNQPLAELETSKAAYDLPSPARGVLKIAVSDECEVAVGSLLGYVGESLAAIEAFLAERASTIQHRLDPAHSRSPAPSPAAPRQESQTSPPISLQLDRSAQVERSNIESDSACVSRSDTTTLRHPATSIRLSQSARKLIEQHGLNESDFANRGLIRAADVLALLPLQGTTSDVTSRGTSDISASPTIRGAAGVPVRTESVSRMKRFEARLLSWSTRQALHSSVVVSVPIESRSNDIGWHVLSLREGREAAACGSATRPSMTQRVSSENASLARSEPVQSAEMRSVRVIHELARLLKEYPAFNGYCSGEQNHFYEQVHIGYALDAGHGLKVPVFRNADRMTVDELLSERRRLVHDYLANALMPESLAGSTFTVSDLSGSGVILFDPLISEAQAAILGIGANHATANGRLAFHLILSFDHRLIEGRAAARFVNELKERLLADVAREPSDRTPSCAICRIPIHEAASRKHFLVTVAGPEPGTSQLVCTICLGGR